METIGELNILMLLLIPLIVGIIGIVFAYTLRCGMWPWEYIWEHLPWT